MHPAWTGLLGHQWILGEKYLGRVPCAASRLDAQPPVCSCLGSRPPEITFCCNMAHDVVPQEVKIVSGPFLPLCQLWFSLARLHVSDLSEECALALNHL